MQLDPLALGGADRAVDSARRGGRPDRRPRARRGHRHGPRPAPAPEDRGRRFPPAASRDGVRRRLPLHAVIELGLIVAAGTLAVGIGLSVALRLLPTVRLQLAGLALLAVGLPL